MVGSATTLQRYAPVEKLLDHLQQENMISFKYTFYLDAAAAYLFLTIPTAVSDMWAFFFSWAITSHYPAPTGRPQGRTKHVAVMED